MSDVTVLLGLFFFMACFTLTVLRSLLLSRLVLLDWAVLAMGGVYGLGWAIVSWVTWGGGNPTWEEWLLPAAPLYLVHTFSAVVLVGGVWLGWILGGGVHVSHPRAILSAPRDIDARLEMAMWVLLVIAVVMQWLYARAYGGFVGLLEYSAQIRSAIFSAENPFSFLRPFGSLALFSSFGFWGLWLSGRRRFSVIAGLTVSVLCSLYILYSWLGRIEFMVYVATFALGALLSLDLRPLRLLVLGGVLCGGILVGTYGVSLWLNLKSGDDLLAFLARELSFPFVSFFAQLSAGEHLSRTFKDFVVAPVFLLPSSWWLNWVEDVSQINTALIWGAPKGEQGVTGSIPVDLLTLGLMQAGVVGIPVVGLMFGALLRIIQRLTDRLPHAGVRAVYGAYILLKLGMLGVFYAQPALFVRNSFGVLVTALIILLILYVPRPALD